MDRRINRAEAVTVAAESLAAIRVRADELIRQARYYDPADRGQARQLLEYAEDLRQSAGTLVAALTVASRA